MRFLQIKYFINRFLLQRDLLTARTDHFDLTLRVKTKDVIGRHLYKYGAHEPKTTEFLKTNLIVEHGDVIFDIGANIGWYSLIFDKVAHGKKIDIFAFEPDPSNFRLLKQNIEQNSADKVTAIQAAIADTAGKQNLHLYGSTNLGRHSMLAIHEGETVEVESMRLDDFWQSQKLGDRIPRFIKMDVEGFELMALKGATDVIAKCPMVMLEYSPRYMRAAAINPADLIEQMLDLRFRPHALSNGRLEAADAEELASTDRQVDLFWLKEAVAD